MNPFRINHLFCKVPYSLYFFGLDNECTFITRIRHAVTSRFCECTIIFLLLRINFEFTIFIVYHYKSTILRITYTFESNKNSLSCLRIRYWLNILFSNSLLFFLVLTLNLIVFCDYEFTVMCCKFNLSNYVLFYEFTIILFNYRELALNSLFFSRNHYES